MENSVFNPDAVRELIDSDLQHAGELLSLLHEEKGLLEKRDGEALKILVENKLTLLRRMEANDATRSSLLRAAGYPGDLSQWPQLLEELSQRGNSALDASWSRLKTTLQKCEELSEVNAKIVKRTQQSVGRLLGILRGQTDAPALYSQSGQTRTHSDNRSITQA
jgi:flagella synthesis protein FlgN